MEFFNKKEEVIDIQLTQHGKYLLSLGKFKPVYYAFYDEEILYDSNFGGFSEIQNNIKPRIQENTPNLKTQYNFTPLDSFAFKSIERLQATEERTQILINPLANSDLGTDRFPAWNILSLSGKFLTGSTTSTLTLPLSKTILNIPQIEARVTYDVIAETTPDDVWDEGIIELIDRGELDGIPGGLLEALASPDFEDASFDSLIFNDGSFFKVAENELILQIVEENAPVENKNFEIEVFEVEDIQDNNSITSGDVHLKPLTFIKENILIVNDILLDESEIKTVTEPEINETFVNYYFDLEVDDEINDAIICQKLKNADIDTYKYVMKEFQCPDKRKPNYQFLNPYAEKDGDPEC